MRLLRVATESRMFSLELLLLCLKEFPILAHHVFGTFQEFFRGWSARMHGAKYMHALYPMAARLSLFYRKSEIIPPENAEVCQGIFDGLPFRSMTSQNGLDTIEDRGFRRLYALQEPFTVKLQKRGLVVILPFGIKDFGRPRTAHKPPAQQACLHKKPSTSGGKMYGTKCTTIFAARLFVVEQVIDPHP